MNDDAVGCPECKKRAQRLKRIRRWLVFSLTLIPILAAAAYPVYVRPQVDQLRHADAIFVIGGYDVETRYPFGADLAKAGWAPNLVLSNPTNAKWMMTFCEKPPAGVSTNQCVVPVPPTTLGEGRELRRLADQNGWRSIIVVTHRAHLSRARYILEHCFSGQLIMVDFPTEISTFRWVYEYVYQTVGYVRALFETC